MEETKQENTTPQLKTLEVVVTVFIACIIVFIFVKIVFF